MKTRPIAGAFAALSAVMISAPLARAQAVQGASFKLPPIGGIVMTPDNKTLIVSLPSEGKLAFFDMMKDKEIKRLAVDFKPSALALQGKRLIAATEGAAAVHVLNLDTLEETKSVKVPGGGVTGLACHPEKGPVYAVNLKSEIYAIDPAMGTAHLTKARGHLVAVDQSDYKFVYTVVMEPISEELIVRDKKGEQILPLLKLFTQMVALKYTSNGTNLALSGFNDNPAMTGLYGNRQYPRQRGLGVSPDGKFFGVACSAGWKAKNDTSNARLQNYVVAVFETSDMKNRVGQIDCGPYPGAIAFHPQLNLGAVYCDQFPPGNPQIVGQGGELAIFNKKSLTTKERLKVLKGVECPIALGFGGQGTKAIVCPLTAPSLADRMPKPVQVTLQFIPLTLSEEDVTTLKNHFGGTSILKKKD
jgi:hypothetical protein